jgi:hypothetical protein
LCLRKYIKLYVSFILLLLFVAGVALPAGAESVNIKVTLDEGFDGKVKRGEGFPLNIKLENNGEAFSGDLLVHFNPSYNTGGAVLVPVELPEGSTKTYQLSLPGLTEDGYSYNQNTEMVQLYKGDWKKGNKVSFSGDKTLKPRFINPDELVMGVLSENYDRLKELRVLPATSIQMIPLTEEMIPKQGLGLEMIDYLIIDEYAVSQLDEQQQKSILDWIQSGGVLVAGAAPDASSSYGQLYSLLPMKVEAESSGSTNFLQVNESEKLTFETINLFTGAVEKDAQVLQMSNNHPAVIKKLFGNGIILQTSFSLGDQPLSTWKGYSTWFKDLINQAKTTSTYTQHYGQDLYDSMYWEFVETNEYFPASHYSIPQLIMIIMIYLVVLVPVLYFVLRKVDKREHSWWIIPSLALIMSIIVFSLGAKDRIAEPQLNQMGVYQVKNGQLVGLQASTLLSNTSGEYRLHVPKGEVYPIPHMNNMQSFDPSTGAVMEEQRKVNEVVFSNVGYWSTKTIYGKAQKEETGEFTVNLSLKDNQITGTIQNGYPYDFEELFIWSGNVKLKLGSLKEGETIKVDQKIKQNFLSGPIMLSTASMHQQTDLEKMKIEKLQYAASVFLFDGSQGPNNQPLIGGITKEAIVNVDIEGKKEKQNNLNLILAPFVAETDFTGEFTITNEMLSTRMDVVSGVIHEKNQNGSLNEIFMEDGEYDYVIQLPEQLKGKKVEINSLKLNVSEHQLIQYSILNRETGEYLEITPDQRSVTLNKDNQIEQYFSKEGELLIKIHKNTQGDPYVNLPTITMKGVVTP